MSSVRRGETRTFTQPHYGHYMIYTITRTGCRWNVMPRGKDCPCVQTDDTFLSNPTVSLPENWDIA